MKNGKDPYEVLGIAKTASKDEVKEAYRELAKKFHPDNYYGNPLAGLAGEKLAEINEAYDEIMGVSTDNGYTTTYSADKGTDGNGSYRNGERSYSGSGNAGGNAYGNGYKGGYDNAYGTGNGTYTQGGYRGTYGDNGGAYNGQNSDYNYYQGNVCNDRYGSYPPQQDYSYRNYRASSCSPCNLLSALCCMDCCCECMGGDCCPCC